MEQPFFYWVPSIACSSIAFVSSDKYPDWKGNILSGSLKKWLERMVIKDHKVVQREMLFKKLGRVRNVVQAPDGYIYIAVEKEGIFKIVPIK